MKIFPSQFGTYQVTMFLQIRLSEEGRVMVNLQNPDGQADLDFNENELMNELIPPMNIYYSLRSKI